MRVEVTDGGASLRLAETMREVPRDLRPAVRRGLVDSAQPIAQDARGRASWSSRIPPSIRVRVSFARGSRTGVAVEARASQAPHARPYEDINGRGVFRHPLFGDREHWYPQATRPFLVPAAQAGRGRVLTHSHAAVRQVLRRHGLT